MIDSDCETIEEENNISFIKNNEKKIFKKKDEENFNILNSLNINDNKEIICEKEYPNEENYLYIGCEDGNIKIIKIKNDSFITRFFN